MESFRSRVTYEVIVMTSKALEQSSATSTSLTFGVDNSLSCALSGIISISKLYLLDCSSTLPLGITAKQPPIPSTP